MSDSDAMREMARQAWEDGHAAGVEDGRGDNYRADGQYPTFDAWWNQVHRVNPLTTKGSDPMAQHKDDDARIVCAHCPRFIERNAADEPDVAEWVHLDDGRAEYDHDAEPAGGSARVVPKFADGSEVVFVAAYQVEREYGGPEDGGWYYDSGDLVAVVVCTVAEREATMAELAVVFPKTDARYNTRRRGEDYDVSWSEEYPVASFPAVRPHYE